MPKSWLQRIFGSPSAKQKPSTTTPAALPPATVAEDIVRWVDGEVAAGFSPRDEIIATALDIYGEDADPDFVRDLATQAVTESLHAHALKQRDWSEPTDCDRLDAAFAGLEASGVISRQHFTCCGTCGSAEIWDEIEAAKEAGRPAHGYAFYHVQDTESAVEGHGIYLNYGACVEGPEAAVAVGHEIVSQLNQHGLRTEWDGRIERRIAVSLDWKRRRQDLTA